MTMVGRDKIIIATVFLAAFNYASSAPLNENGTSQSLQYANAYGEGQGCYYNFEHYEEGDRILTNEPCLNCTCHNRMLMCYLRVCPFTKAIGQDCTVEKKPDQCCPIITCPQVPVALLTSSTTSETPPTTAIGRPDNYGCTLEGGTFYADGAQVPSDPRKPCELCYCIRNHTACVIQECTLNVEGCKPVYQEGVCCPVRYDCDYDEVSTTPKPLGLVTTPGGSSDCLHNGALYRDGAMVMKDLKTPCEHCYCMRGDIVCAVQECGKPLEGRDCTPLVPTQGKCCPNYHCTNRTEATMVNLLETVSTGGFSDAVKGESGTTEKQDSNEADSSSEESQEIIESKPASPTYNDEDSYAQNGHVPNEVTDSIQPTEGPHHSPDEMSSESGTTVAMEPVETQKPGVIDNEASTDSDSQASSQHQETTHHVPHEVTGPQIVNEIPESTTHDQPSVPTTEEAPVEAPRIPGEGSCLVEGITYPHNTIVPTENPCQEVCRCYSSIIRCKPRDCPPAPSPDENCMPVTTPGSCCPTYMCDQNTSDIPEVENHKVDNIPSEDGSHVYQEIPSSLSPVVDQATEVPDISTAAPIDSISTSSNPTSPNDIPASVEVHEVPQTHTDNELNLPGVEEDTPVHQDETQHIPTTEQATESNQITQDETSGSSIPNVVDQMDAALYEGQENVDSNENKKPHHPVSDPSTVKPFIDEVTSEEMISATASQNNADSSSQTETVTLESGNKFGSFNEDDVGSGEEPSIAPSDNQQVSSEPENQNFFGSPETTEHYQVEHTSANPKVPLEGHTDEVHQTSEGISITSEETKTEETFTEGVPVGINSSENPHEHASSGDSQSESGDNETEPPQNEIEHKGEAQVTEGHQLLTDAVTLVPDSQASSTHEPTDNDQTVSSHVKEQEPTETTESSTLQNHNVIQEDVTTTSEESHSSTTENIPQDIISQEQTSTEGENPLHGESPSEQQTEKPSTSHEVNEITEEPASPVSVNIHDSVPESTETSTEFVQNADKETNEKENVKEEDPAVTSIVPNDEKVEEDVVPEKVPEDNKVVETTEQHVGVSSESSSTTLGVIKEDEPITGAPVQIETSSHSQDKNEDDISTIIYEEVKVPGMPPIESHMTEGTTTHLLSSTTETSSYPVTQGPEGITVKQPDDSHTTENQLLNTDNESSTQTVVDPQSSTEGSHGKPEGSETSVDAEHEINQPGVNIEIDKKPEDANGASSFLSETIHHVSSTPEIVNEINEEKESLNHVTADNGVPTEEDINQLIQNEVNKVLYPGEQHELLPAEPATGEHQIPAETVTESNLNEPTQTPEAPPEIGINSETAPKVPAAPLDSVSESSTIVTSDSEKSELPSTDIPNVSDNQENPAQETYQGGEVTASPAVSEDSLVQSVETSSSIPSHDESLKDNEQAVTTVHGDLTSEQPSLTVIEAGENTHNGETDEHPHNGEGSEEVKPLIDEDQTTSSEEGSEVEKPHGEDSSELGSHSEITPSETTQSPVDPHFGSTVSGSVNEGAELGENQHSITEIYGGTPVEPAVDENKDNLNKIPSETQEDNLPVEQPSSVYETIPSTDSSQDQILETTSIASSHDDSPASAEVTHVETNVPQIPDSANQLLDPAINEESAPATDQSIHTQESIGSSETDQQITEEASQPNVEENVQPDSEENTVSVENVPGSEHTSARPEHQEQESGHPQETIEQQHEHHGTESDSQETQSQNVETVTAHSEPDQPVEKNEHPETEPEQPLEAPKHPISEDEQSIGGSETEQPEGVSVHSEAGIEHPETGIQQSSEGLEAGTKQPLEHSENAAQPHVEGVEHPEEGSEHVETGSEGPVEEPKYPEGGSDQAEIGSEQTVEGLEHPGTGTEQPVEGSEHTGSQQPVEGSVHPEGGVDHPEAGTEQSVEGSEISSGEHPVDGSEHSDTGAPAVVSQHPEEESDHSEPIEVPEHPEGVDHSEAVTEQSVEGSQQSATEQSVDGSETGAQQPVEATEHTENEAQQTVEATEHTENDAQQPVEGSEHTENDAQQPVEGSEHNENEAQQPVEGSEHTENDAQQPVEGSEHTENDAQQPVEGSEHTENEAQQPVEGSEHTENETQQPLEKLEHPESGTEQPVEGSVHFETEAHKPVESTEQTKTEAQQPVESTEQTETEAQQPVEGFKHPESGTEQPLEGSEHTETEAEHPESEPESPQTESEQLQPGTGHPASESHHATVGNEQSEEGSDHTVSDNQEEGSYQETVTEYQVTEVHQVTQPEQGNTENLHGEVVQENQGGETESAAVTEQEVIGHDEAANVSHQETSSVQYETEQSPESTSQHQEVMTGSLETSSEHPTGADVEKEPIVNESDITTHQDIENDHEATTSSPLVQSSSEIPVEGLPQTEGPHISEKPESTGEQGASSGEPQVHKQEIPTTEDYHPSSSISVEQEQIEVSTEKPGQGTNILQSVVHSTETVSETPTSSMKPMEEDTHMFPTWSQKPFEHHTTPEPHVPEEGPYPSGYDPEYEDEEGVSYGPGTCRYGGKVYLSAQQIPRDDPCDFCFCFRSDIICLQQSCPPPIRGCYQETIKGFCCPRYECHVSMATMLNITTTTTTTTTTLPPHFFAHAYNGAATKAGCQVKGVAYHVGERIPSTSGPCLECRCGANGQMKCDPTVCGPQEALLRQVMDAAVSRRRRR